MKPQLFLVLAGKHRTRPTVLRGIVLFIMTLILLLAPWQTVRADTFTVNDPGDAPDINPGDGVCETEPENGVCTLRAAIMEANALLATHPHSIVVPAYTIALVNGSLDITAPITLAITGAGAGATIIDGGGADRVFNIALPAANVTISDVTIQNGATSGNGGGILNSGTLVVSNSVIQSNSAVWFGGGIFSDSGGNVTIQGSTIITGNSATAPFGGGGGISAGGTLLITGGSTIGSTNTGTFGGGVNAFGTTTVTGGASITANSGGLGGGVFNAGSSFTIQDATMTLNTSTGGGGAIFNQEGTRTVLITGAGTSIGPGNSGSDGGAVYNDGLGSTVTVQSGAQITGNSVTHWGGGLYNRRGGILNVTSGVQVTNNSAQHGGAISNESSGQVTIDSVTISGNVGSEGTIYNNGFYLGFPTTLNVTNTLITGNAVGRGGGVFNSGSAFAFIGAGTVITGNTATGFGGGVFNGAFPPYVGDGSPPQLSVSDGATIANNSAPLGGAIYNADDAIVTVSGSILQANAGTDDGGAYYSAAAGNSDSITGSCIVQNSATAVVDGGGAALSATGNWWGAANGPGGAGPGLGDTVSTNVDFSGFLTAPILGCPEMVVLPSLSINDISLAEGDAGTTDFIFTVTLSAAVSFPVSVDYATADGTATAGVDYVAASGTLTFAPGVVSQPITVTVNGDTTPEPHETFLVNLSDAVNATITDAQGVGTILNDDAALSINDVSVTEGDSGTTVDAIFTVSLPYPSVSTVMVDYATADDTATAGVDYVATSGTLTFAPGVLTQTITVTANGDDLIELDETFFVNLSNPGSATITDAQGVGTILNDDMPAVSIDDVSVTEGDSGTTVDAVFTVTLSEASVYTVTVDYATADGTATGGVDYVAAGGTLTFVPGVVTQPIAVTVNGDDIVEMDETFFVNLSNPVNASITDAQGAGTILNDDVPDVSIDDVSVTEGDTGTTVDALFTVTLSQPSFSTVTVDFATADGTATAGVDYVAAGGTLTFAPGVVTQPIAVTVNGDDIVEADETFFVNLTNPTNAALVDAQGVGTILNDDVAGYSFAPATLGLLEGTSGSYTIRLTSQPVAPVTLTLAVNLPAQCSVTPTVVLDATNWNTATDNVTVTITGDDIVEVPHPACVVAHTVTTADPVYAALAAPPDYSVTVTDDDTAGYFITPPTLALTEGASGNYTIRLTSQPVAPVTLTLTVNLPAQCSVTPTVVLDATNWNTASDNVTVTITGDDIVEAPHPDCVVAHAVTTADPVYAALAAPPDYTVTVTDDDVAGYSFAPPTLALTEGASGIYTLRLTSQPVAPVTLTLTVNLPAQCSVTPAVVLDATNWNTATDNVTVTILADDIAEVPHPDCVVAHAVTTADPVYAALAAPPDYTVTVTDDDVAGYSFAPPTLALTEGASGSYTIRLTSQPVAPVTLTLTVNLPAQCSVTPTVVLDATNWNTATDNVTVTILDDDIAEMPHPDCVVAHTVATADPVYATLTPPDYTVTVTDNDVPAVVVTPTSLHLPDDAATATYDVSLATTPSAGAVTVVATFDPTLLTVNGGSLPVTLIFTDTTPQTLTVAALPGAFAGGYLTTLITHAITASDAAEYAGLSVASVTVTIGTPPEPEVVAAYPPPPPVPRCIDENFVPNSPIRASIPDSYSYAVFCRSLVENGQYLNWFGGSLTHAGQVGSAGVLELNVFQAVDVFSPTGLTHFEGGAVICLRGSGRMLWLSASQAPRVPQDIETFQIAEFGGFSCAVLHEPGTLVLAHPNGAAAGASAPASATPLSDCTVTTRYMMNLREGPGTDTRSIRLVAYKATLTAFQRVGNWFEVDYHGTRGWLSGDYVTPHGACGQ
jgi:hypothetical protein